MKEIFKELLRQEVLAEEFTKEGDFKTFYLGYLKGLKEARSLIWKYIKGEKF